MGDASASLRALLPHLERKADRDWREAIEADVASWWQTMEAEAIAGAWQQALAADRPTVLDVHCDPDVPPIPPHATFEQMKDAALALAKGDPDRWSVVKEGLKTKVQELIPRRATT